MARLINLVVDTTNKQILVTADSTGQQVIDGITYSYKFSDIYTDNTTTFNCANEPSSSATKTTITITLDYNQNLVNYPVPFDNVLCSDVSTELIFAWVEEKKYLEYDKLTWFTTTETVAEPNDTVYLYVTDGTLYYKAKINSDLTLSDFNFINQIAYNTAYENRDDPSSYTIETYNDREGVNNPKNFYFSVTGLVEEVETTVYTHIAVSGGETEITTITEYTYTNSRYKEVDFNYEASGTTFSATDFYESLLEYIDIEDGTCCKADCSDINFILAWNGFALAKALGNYQQMVYYWNILHNLKSTNTNCGCNG